MAGLRFTELSVYIITLTLSCLPVHGQKPGRQEDQAKKETSGHWRFMIAYNDPARQATSSFKNVCFQVPMELMKRQNEWWEYGEGTVPDTAKLKGAWSTVQWRYVDTVKHIISITLIHETIIQATDIKKIRNGTSREGTYIVDHTFVTFYRPCLTGQPVNYTVHIGPKQILKE